MQAPAPPAPTTPSAALRAQGNSIYRSIDFASLSPVLQHSRLEAALEKYDASLRASTSDEERASVCKNLGVIHKRLAVLQARPECAAAHRRSSLAAYTAAADYGASSSGGKPEPWVELCQQEALLGLDQLKEAAEELPTTARLCEMERVRQALDGGGGPGGVAAAHVLLKLAQALHNWGVVYFDRGEEERALRAYYDASRPLEEAFAACRRSGANGTDLQDALKGLEKQLFVQRCICESTRTRAAADACLAGALPPPRRGSDDEDEGDEEQGQGQEVDVALVLEIADDYKQAILLVREADLETEAIALSRLGTLFRRALGDKARATQYYLASFRLAESAWPRSFNSELWFREARQGVLDAQREAFARDQAALRAEREGYLQQLEQELTALKKAAERVGEDQWALVKHVYEAHPPRNPVHRLDPGETNLKKALLTAVQHYHPDKQAGQDKLWCVLAEEITKRLNGQYSAFKGAMPSFEPPPPPAPASPDNGSGTEGSGTECSGSEGSGEESMEDGSEYEPEEEEGSSEGEWESEWETADEDDMYG